MKQITGRIMQKLSMLFGFAGLLIASPLLPAVLFGAGHTQFESALAVVVLAIGGATLGWVIGLVVWLATPPPEAPQSATTAVGKSLSGRGRQGR